MNHPSEQSVTTAIKPLWQALNEKVLPWANDKSQCRCIVATPTLRELQTSRVALPDGVTASRRERLAKRVRVSKGDQRIGRKMATYRWPEDGLLCKRTPQLACVISGQSDFRVGNYILRVPAGFSVVIPPGVPYPDGSRAHVEGRGACDILWLTLWSGAFRCWICRSRDDQHFDSQHAEACFFQESRAATYFQALSDEAAAREAGYQPVCESLLLVLWTVLHRSIGQGRFFQHTQMAMEDEGPILQTDDPIPLAQQYIRLHLHSHLTLAGVAQRVYLSRAQFARRFHEETGQTFVGFVTECRIEEAKRLLVETDWPLSTVSELTGVTPAHLRDIFVRHTGQSPREFRQARQLSTPE